MTGSSPASRVAETIARLRTLSQLDIRNQWRLCEHDLPVAEGCNPAHWQTWPIAPANENGYIVWERGHQIRWLCQQITVPHDLYGYVLEGMVLRLALTVWTDPTHVFVNGQLVQECDLFDHSPRILLSERVTPGETIAVALRLVSPGHDDGALMKSLCLYETPRQDAPYLGEEGDRIREPSFLADELAALEIFLTTLDPEQLPLLEQATGKIAWDAIHDPPRFQQSIHHLYQTLQPLADWIQQRQICLLGHSHLDLVWLWTWAETCDVAERMFKSVLSLQQDYADLVFCHSSPALYAWVEDHRPALFAAIQAQIQAGRWEVLGGMWVEPELNLLHGESLVRQVLYGQQYVQSRFGRLDRIAWLPDSFGFCWQLPQILSQGGIEYLVTQKLTWNDRTKFPHAAFWWQAPDGSRIFTVMSSMVGESIDPIKMATYASQWEQSTNIPNALWLFGVGDHGGGPTRDMLEVAERWRSSPLFPQLTSSTALDYLQSICKPSRSDPNASAFPTWADELYLECHRGSYTTHGDQKRWNRRCEELLYQAELWSSLATIATAAPYPHDTFNQCWRTLLFNQFHDILPGSSIPEVFAEANAAWQQLEDTAMGLRDQALATLVQHVALPTPPAPDCQPIVVVNSLNWQRSNVVQISSPDALGGQVMDRTGQMIPSQRLSNGHLAFVAENIPPVGYQLFWWQPQGNAATANTVVTPDPNVYVLDNDYLRISVDPVTGDLTSVFDKTQQRQVLSGAGNQLQAFVDEHKYWDAWNIDPNYEQHPLPPSELQSIDWVDCGSVCQRVRVVRTIANSTLQQDYVLEASSPWLRIETIADWQDHHLILKAAFPLATQADYATYEIPCGAIQRPTQSTDPRQEAKWEVPALRWADLAGVSILNNCKYAYDSKPNQLRLTLLRGSCWPDPRADIGRHEFAYALYPHAGDWRAAQTVQYGYEFNQPLQVVFVPTLQQGIIQQRLPSKACLLDLQANNLVLTALKPREDDATQWILRCYEAHGQGADVHLTSDLGLEVIDRVDLLERSLLHPPHSTTDPYSVSIAPWQIATLVIKVATSMSE